MIVTNKNILTELLLLFFFTRGQFHLEVAAGSCEGWQRSRVLERCSVEERTSRQLSLAATNVIARVLAACIY